jgi:hypothetical protein
VLNVPSTPLLLAIPAGPSNDGSVSYDITASLTSLHSSQLATRALIATPEPGTMQLLAVSSMFLGVGMLRRTRRENRSSARVSTALTSVAIRVDRCRHSAVRSIDRLHRRIG